MRRLNNRLLDSLGDHRLLSAAEELRLLRAAQCEEHPHPQRARDKAREKLLRHNVRLVAKVVGRFTPPTGMTEEDLMQAGMAGLLRAVEKFDPDSGHRLSTYAVPWVRQAISRQIANGASLIRLPVHLREQIGKLRRAEARLRNSHGRHPSPRELAAETGLDEDRQEQIERAIDVSAHPASLDAPVAPSRESDGNGERALVDLVDDGGASQDPAETVAGRIDDAAFCGRLAEALASLPDEQARVLRLRFGLEDLEPLTLAAAGEIVGLSQEGVRNYQKRALATLRQTLKDTREAKREDAA